MPCYEPSGADYTRAEQQDRANKLEAVLCGIFTVLDAKGLTLLDSVNWKEVGVSRRWAERWWEKHLEQDRLRKERKTREIKEAAEADAALAKLTTRERELLKKRL